MSDPRAAKGQRRIGVILQEIPAAREQLVVAMEELGSDFAEEAFLAAARSLDARERNRVAVIERLYEVLLNWLHELAARGLAEGQRLGVVDKASGSPGGASPHSASSRAHPVSACMRPRSCATSSATPTRRPICVRCMPVC
ncbi:MAG TPA: hypothetical protein VGI76_09210 [Solirubrobacteraceae bacterium]